MTKTVRAGCQVLLPFPGERIRPVVRVPAATEGPGHLWVGGLLLHHEQVQEVIGCMVRWLATGKLFDPQKEAQK